MTGMLHMYLPTNTSLTTLLTYHFRTPAEILEGTESAYVGHRNITSEEALFGGPNAPSRRSHGTHTSTHSAISNKLDVEELEMLLEAYFVQIDGTLNKLSTVCHTHLSTWHSNSEYYFSFLNKLPFSMKLREYVDDTEDYINIMLDDKQNHLLQMGVMLTTATLVVSAFVVVAGIFGMNITIELFKDEVHGMTRFLWTVGGGSAGTVFLYVIAIAWCKHRRLLE